MIMDRSNILLGSLQKISFKACQDLQQATGPTHCSEYKKNCVRTFFW